MTAYFFDGSQLIPKINNTTTSHQMAITGLGIILILTTVQRVWGSIGVKTLDTLVASFVEKIHSVILSWFISV